MSALYVYFLIPVAVDLTVTFLGGIGALAGRHCRRSRATAPTPPRVLRCFSLLGTTDADGAPLRHETVLVPGSIVIFRLGGLSQRFELTDVPFGDGTYVAEPLDRSYDGRSTDRPVANASV